MSKQSSENLSHSTYKHDHMAERYIECSIIKADGLNIFNPGICVVVRFTCVSYPYTDVTTICRLRTLYIVRW